MKTEMIECNRCQTQTRADSREAVSYTKVSVLKGGACKEYDLCPNDADEFKKWLGPDATPINPEADEQATVVQEPGTTWAGHVNV